MALIKNKTTDFGIDADYWKVDMVCIDRHRKEVSFSMNLYLVKGATKFLESKGLSLNLLEDADRIERYNAFFETNAYPNVYRACYEYAKQYEEYFMDAVDDEDELL